MLDQRFGCFEAEGDDVMVWSEFGILDYRYITYTVIGVSEYKIQRVSLDMGGGLNNLDKIEIKHSVTNKWWHSC